MKTLIALGIGIALGLALKKPKKIKDVNCVIVDDRETLGEHLFGSEGKEALKKFIKQNGGNLGV